MARIRIVIIGTLLSALVVSTNVSAAITDAEMLALPPFCQARLKGNEDAKRAWGQSMGAKQFLHVHHYCFGLNFMSQAAMEFDPKKKKFSLQRAISNFDYVLKRWPKEFSLTQSAALYRQQAEMMLSMTR